MNNKPAHPPVFFIIGPVGHGKTEVRNIICKLTGFKGASCSDVIYAFLAERRQVPVAELFKIPKEELRPALIEAGDFMCGHGRMEEKAKDDNVDDAILRIPSCLVRSLYHCGIRVIDGVRRPLELDQSRAHLQWNNVDTCVIWVEKPAVSPGAPDNTVVSKDLADHVVINDGTKADLEIKVEAILKKRYGMEEIQPEIYTGPEKKIIV